MHSSDALAQPRPTLAPLAPQSAAAPVHAGEADLVAGFAAEQTLDVTRGLIEEGLVEDAFAQLIPGLLRARAAMSSAAWRAFAGGRCLEHPLGAVMHEDPFIHRAFAKPRGYAGDAGVLDLIYGAVPMPLGTTERGARLYAASTRSAACDSVRFRRDLLADAIDSAARETPRGARVLSLACGHLREAQRSAAVAAGDVAQFFAVDQDELSIARVRRECAPLGVSPILGSVRDVIAGRLTFDGLSLAYAAGLYDYLPTPVAMRLTARLFAMLAPGGRLLVANFCPELPDVGVMESYMAWPLIYRGDDEVAALGARIPAEEVAAWRVFRDANGCVAYLEVRRG
jgi:extracellular factor (EF) 3-hydroxypalmitic acid methyl ester biosynthesis protein